MGERDLVSKRIVTFIDYYLNQHFLVTSLTLVCHFVYFLDLRKPTGGHIPPHFIKCAVCSCMDCPFVEVSTLDGSPCLLLPPWGSALLKKGSRGKESRAVCPLGVDPARCGSKATCSQEGKNGCGVRRLSSGKYRHCGVWILFSAQAPFLIVRVCKCC